MLTYNSFIHGNIIISDAIFAIKSILSPREFCPLSLHRLQQNTRAYEMPVSFIQEDSKAEFIFNIPLFKYMFFNSENCPIINHIKYTDTHKENGTENSGRCCFIIVIIRTLNTTIRHDLINISR